MLHLRQKDSRSILSKSNVFPNGHSKLQEIFVLLFECYILDVEKDFQFYSSTVAERS